MKINETSSVIVDLSEDLALGDTVLRIGALKTLHRNCRELYVISHRADLLRDSGIQNIISYSDVAKLLASIDFVVRPASWIGNSKKFWSEISLDNKTGFIDGLLDCRHDYDIEQIRNNPRYFNPERSVINRVHKNFVSQLREFTEFDIGLCDVVHGMTAHAIASNLSKEYYGSPEHSHDKILAIADSSSISSKSWPHFADLVNRLNAMRPDLKYAFVSKDSAFDSEKIKSLNNPQSVVYSAARDDIKESWNVMKQCFAFLGNDSGPGHYYSMIHSGKRPMLVLFYAKNDPSRWMPFSISSDFIYADRSGSLIDKGHYDYLDWQKDYDSARFRPMNLISVDDVAERLIPLIR